MNTSLDKIMIKIADAARRGDLVEVERLTPVASRMRQISEHKHTLETEFAELERTLDSSAVTQSPAIAGMFTGIKDQPHRIARRATRGGLCVEVDFPRSGKLRLEESTAAETLVALMEHVHTNFGQSALEKLGSLRTARGPLVSQNPRGEFLNPRRHELYAHHRIPRTGFYVLTHSSTIEKVEQIQRALKAVGLPSHSFRVSAEANGRR